jgi:hypothetical protein
VYIFASPGLAPCRYRPLSSNVRPHNNVRSTTRMKFIDDSAFLTTFGREFCAALSAIPEEDLPEGTCSHDCYSVFTETFDKPPSVETLEKMTDEDFVKLAEAFNRYFEVSAVTPEPLERARQAVLWHWQP